jgi:hypothetical protein
MGNKSAVILPFCPCTMALTVLFASFQSMSTCNDISFSSKFE